MTEKLPLSLAIITFNEESNLARTLSSVADIAGEIIIVDSGSIDKTLEIAAGFGADIYNEEWKGFSGQKNSALEKCKYDWILCIDADEQIGAELKQSIIDVVQKNDAGAFYIRRRTFYLGKLLKYSWQPDWQLRLVHKSVNPRWKGDKLHESLSVSIKPDKLQGDIIHYSYNDLSHHFRKTLDYARISAESYNESGRKFHFINILINPVINWVRLYIFNFAFLDGVRGFIAGMSGFIYTFLKYAYLWELQHRDDSNRKDSD